MAEALESRDEQSPPPESGEGAAGRILGQARAGVRPGQERASTANGVNGPSGPPPPTLAIAAGCSFEGLLSFDGSTRIDGELIGEVIARGTLHLGPSARALARIEVDELIVEGELEGDVVARFRIELAASARVRGSIQAPRLLLAEGCTFQGRCRCIP